MRLRRTTALADLFMSQLKTCWCIIFRASRAWSGACELHSCGWPCEPHARVLGSNGRSNIIHTTATVSEKAEPGLDATAVCGDSESRTCDWASGRAQYFAQSKPHRESPWRGLPCSTGLKKKGSASLMTDKVCRPSGSAAVLFCVLNLPCSSGPRRSSSPAASQTTARSKRTRRA